MYDKNLKLREPETETIYISKAERYELIAILAKSVQSVREQEDTENHDTTH